MHGINETTKELIRQYQNWYWAKQPQEGVAVIHVDEIASRVATFYEKIRKIVDWREEHLMRRIAVERILKRRLLVKKNGSDAESFIFELIRGGHFPNDRIPKTNIQTIQRLIDKYIFILENSSPPPKGKLKSQMYTQLLGVAACEVEEVLDPPVYIRADALVEYMYTFIKERIGIGEKARQLERMTEEDINTQIYIAVGQALLRLDQTTITYNLLKIRYPNWLELSQEFYPQVLEEIASNIYLIFRAVENELTHPLANKFYKICDRYDIPYLLTGDIIDKNPRQIEERISDPEALEELVKAAYNKRLGSLKSRTRRAAFYSTLSIFLTNVFSLYLVEIPFARYVTGSFNHLAEIADVFVPTLLMALLVVTIKPPGKDNLLLVINETKKNVYGSQKKDLYEIELYPKRGLAFKIIIGIIYILSFCICFGVILWFLYKLNFPPLSYLIFIIFTSLIAFTGMKIRQRARELHITKERVSFLHIITDPFSLPIIHVGKWLSARWARYNIVAVTFNFLVDTPFLVFAEFLEHWRNFIKEKKDDIH